DAAGLRLEAPSAPKRTRSRTQCCLPCSCGLHVKVLQLLVPDQNARLTNRVGALLHVALAAWARMSEDDATVRLPTLSEFKPGYAGQLAKGLLKALSRARRVKSFFNLVDVGGSKLDYFGSGWPLCDHKALIKHDAELGRLPASASIAAEAQR